MADGVQLTGVGVQLVPETSAGGITQLTGDVTASGSGSVAATLATAQPGAHTWAAAQTLSVAPVFTDQAGTRSALGLGTAAVFPVGTTGTNVLGALGGNNAWAGDQTFAGAVTMSALPTADPGVAGQLWNNGGVVNVSTGA